VTPADPPVKLSDRPRDMPDSTEVIDSLPPKTWDVTVWQPRPNHHTAGRIDPADVKRIVSAVLDALSPPT
jgi:hypothetical protein